MSAAWSEGFRLASLLLPPILPTSTPRGQLRCRMGESTIITEIHWRAKTWFPAFLAGKPEALSAGISFLPVRGMQPQHAFAWDQRVGEAPRQLWAVPARRAGCAPHLPLPLSSLNKPLSKSMANAEQREPMLDTDVVLCCGLVNLQLLLLLAL